MFKGLEWDKKAVGLAALLFIGEAIAGVLTLAYILTDPAMWAINLALIAQFIGAFTIMLYVPLAVLTNNMPFVKRSEYDERRRYAEKILGVDIPFDPNGGGVIEYDYDKTTVYRALGQEYSHNVKLDYVINEILSDYPGIIEEFALEVWPLLETPTRLLARRFPPRSDN